ncbi:MAG: AzlD domain-containing protein [Paracoccaceae bacterium]
MNYSNTEIWIIIAALGIGTFLIRFSFLGAFGTIELPPWAMRLLRYTPVAVLPGLVAPLVLWPQATGGQPDIARITAALVALALGMYFKNVLAAMFGAAITLYLLMFLLS